MTTRALPCTIQSFKKIRTEGYVYVDKTDLARLLKIAELLEVDIRELIVKEYDAYLREKMKRNNNEQELYGHNITDRRSHGLRQERGS